MTLDITATCDNCGSIRQLSDSELSVKIIKGYYEVDTPDIFLEVTCNKCKKKFELHIY
jgi:Fe2+ or Zn2+ uptake regulation protein